jgi:hypothetical protein
METPEGQWSLCGHVCRWENNIKVGVNGTVCDAVDWIHVAGGSSVVVERCFADVE